MRLAAAAWFAVVGRSKIQRKAAAERWRIDWSVPVLWDAKGGGSEILGAFEFSAVARAPFRPRRAHADFFFGQTCRAAGCAGTPLPVRFRVRANGRDELRCRDELGRVQRIWVTRFRPV
jgi:hypothetical protein